GDLAMAKHVPFFAAKSSIKARTADARCATDGGRATFEPQQRRFILLVRPAKATGVGCWRVRVPWGACVAGTPIGWRSGEMVQGMAVVGSAMVWPPGSLGWDVDRDEPKWPA